MSKLLGVIIFFAIVMFFTFFYTENQLSSVNQKEPSLGTQELPKNSEERKIKFPQINQGTASNKKQTKKVASNNESITDLWANDSYDLSRIPHLPLMTYINELETAIQNDDADAAMHLFFAHTRCSNIPKSLEEVEEKSTKQSSNGETFISRDSYEFYLERFTYCEGFESLSGTENKYQLAYLIRLAARKGNIDAKLLYSGAGFPYPLNSEEDFIKYAQQIVIHKEESIRHLVDARSLGSITALGLLGDVYYNGILAEVNHIEAYAYYHASEIALNPPYDNLRLVELANKMSQEEIDTAIKLGNKYSKCCT